MSNPLGTHTSSTPEENGDFKPWRCGDEYHYLPEKGGDPDEHWKTVVDHLVQKERSRCEAWKDEVDKLLVFAGLFSAVVTGLLVESYKSLSEDPIQMLLTQLVAQGSNQTVAVASGSSGRFSASESSKRVNTLWFLSLVLSLATALLGIVSQQWLREHTRPSPQNTPLRQLPALLHMQAEALDRFFVPQLFTTLPLLLIISVVLFLIGMVDFLWALNHQVAIPVSIAVFFVFAFLICTTIYPAFQSTPCQIPRQKPSTPRVPCPYKSPQSSAFYTSVSFVKRKVLFGIWDFSIRYYQSEKVLNYCGAGFTRIEQLKAGWSTQAMLWLSQRDLDVLAIHQSADLEALSTQICETPTQHLTYGMYDTVKSLQLTQRELFSEKSNKLLHSYQCFRELIVSEQFFFPESDNGRILDLCNQYIFTEVFDVDGYFTYLRFDNHNDSFFMDSLLTSEPLPNVYNDFLLDHMRLRFLSNDKTRIPNVAHCSELAVRLLRWPTEHISKKFALRSQIGQNSSDPFDSLGRILFLSLPNAPDDLQMAVHIQLRHHLVEFFEGACHYHPDEYVIGHTLITSQYVIGLLATGSFLSANPAGFDELKKSIIPMILDSFSKQKEPVGLEYLLVAVAIFMAQWHDHGDLFTPQEMDSIFSALNAYNKRCDAAYVHELLDSIRPSRYTEWPTYFIDQHLSSNHPLHIHSNSLASLKSSDSPHITVDISPASPLSPHDLSDLPQSIEDPGIPNEGCSPHIQPCPPAARAAWRPYPRSLRRNEQTQNFNIDTWDASL